MSNDPKISLSPTLDRAEILAQLGAVLDPELDESILTLGFVDAVTAQWDDGSTVTAQCANRSKGSHLTVELQLPTFWCAANFSYLMASDVRRNLLMVDGVDEVTVRLPGHFASEAIESGVNSGESFAQAFPDEAWDNLDQLRDVFLRKGYINRQENLLRNLRAGGLTNEAIAALCIEDLRLNGDSCWVRRDEQPEPHILPASLAQRYLERRAELGIDCSPASPLVCDLNGQAVPAHQMEDYFVRSRTTRLASEANGALCSALLQARRTGTVKSR